MTIIYNYHPATREYLNEATARPDPLESKPMIPAHATIKKPPKTKINEAAIFENDGWQIVPDYRGAEYWLPDGSAHTILELNQELPSDALSEKPAPQSPTAEELVAIYRGAVGRHIDAMAVRLGFDSIVTAVTYADEPADDRNQKYGLALRAWRSECWKACRDVLVAWQSGTLQEEITEQGLIDKLPVFVAPAL